MEITNLTEIFQIHCKCFSSYSSVAFQFLMKSSEFYLFAFLYFFAFIVFLQLKFSEDPLEETLLSYVVLLAYQP